MSVCSLSLVDAFEKIKEVSIERTTKYFKKLGVDLIRLKNKLTPTFVRYFYCRLRQYVNY